ncbi:NfeD family protein [Egbenema bharatensis]|uniref:NfeD family protein n=1 Tax=Egbenema bharatensis TaxID=3463334 RepID=UPI003A8B0285
MFTFQKSSDQRATVEETIRPNHSGRVRFQGSWWFARCQADVTIEPGEEVKVIGHQGITLLVEPMLAFANQGR